MKIGYLILAHNQPEHLKRLVNTILTHSESYCFIHIDKKSTSRFDEIDDNRVVYLKHNIEFYWCDFSTVEATVLLVKEALSDPRNIEFMVLLSGSCYPIKNLTYIHNYYEQRQQHIFMGSDRLPSKVYGKSLDLATKYIDRPTQNSLSTLSRRILKKIGFIPRNRNFQNYLPGLDPYSGHQWWAINREIAIFIAAGQRNNSKLYDFYKNVWCPDDAYFQTVLENSEFSFRIRNNTTYTDWSDGPPHPRDLDLNSLQLLMSDEHVNNEMESRPESKYLFARKFTEKSNALLHAIDSSIMQL